MGNAYEHSFLVDWPPAGQHVEWGPEAAGFYEFCTRNLELFARVFVGEPVTIRWFRSTKLLGQAFRQTGVGAVIRLNSGAGAAELGRVFFHECGHLATPGHCKMITPVDPDFGQDDDTTATEIIACMSEPERAYFSAQIDKEETEADAYAAQALAAFEAEFGPFLDVISGRIS